MQNSQTWLLAASENGPFNSRRPFGSSGAARIAILFARSVKNQLNTRRSCLFDAPSASRQTMVGVPPVMACVGKFPWFLPFHRSIPDELKIILRGITSLKTRVSVRWTVTYPAPKADDVNPASLLFIGWHAEQPMPRWGPVGRVDAFSRQDGRVACMRAVRAVQAGERPLSDRRP